MNLLLDNTGRVVWVIADNKSGTEETIGYIIKIKNTSEFSEEPLKFKFYTEYGTFATYFVADKISVDGKRYHMEDFREKIYDNVIDIEGEFAAFKLNEDGFLTFLDTEATVNEENSKVTPLTDESGNKISFIAHSSRFGNIHNYPAGEGIYEDTYLQQPLKRDTLAFIIPVDENKEPVDYGFEDFYKVSTAERTWTTLDPITERTEFHGLDKNNYPTFGVRYKTYATGAAEGLRAVDDNDAMGMVVTKVKNAIGKDNEIVKKIHGYDIESGREVVITSDGSITKFIEMGRIQQNRSEWVNGETKYLKLPTPSSVTEANEQAMLFATYCKDIAELKKGDVVLYQLVGDYINSLERVFSIDDVDYSTYTSNKGSYYTSGSRSSYPDTMGASFKLMYGKVKGFSGNVIKFENDPQNSGGRFPMYINYTKMSTVFVVEDGRVKVDSASNLPAHVSTGDEMVVYSSTGSFRSAIVYK